MSNFTVEQTVPEQTVQDLLDCAWEGGSNYWAQADGPSSQAFESSGVKIFVGDEVHVLNQEKLARGLQTLCSDWPWHWAHLFNDNMDAETGDVFLQCCLFGTIVYG